MPQTDLRKPMIRRLPGEDTWSLCIPSSCYKMAYHVFRTFPTWREAIDYALHILERRAIMRSALPGRYRFYETQNDQGAARLHPSKLANRMENRMSDDNASTLHAEDLLSRWGFDDGGLFDDCAYNLGLDSRQVLSAAVKAYLLPKLKQAVEIVEFPTHHNPIRAKRVDGRAVDWYNDNPQINLEPGFVNITNRDILALFPTPKQFPQS